MRYRFTLLILSSLALLSFVPGEMRAEEKTRTWTGTWNNKKYGTSGPLKCVAKTDGQGNWDAIFTGEFKRDPFKYTAKFKSMEKGRQTLLSGDATIRGHKYQWQGAMKGNTLTGQYKSTVGYYGQFVLKESP